MNVGDHGGSQRGRVHLRSHSKIHRVPVAKGILFEEGAGQLAIGSIDVRFDRIVQRPLADVAHDAHDRLPWGFHSPADLFPNGVLSRPEFPSRGQAHDRYRLRLNAVFGRKPPALKGNAHRLKVVSHYPGLANRLRRFAFGIAAAFDGHGNHFTGIERQIV